MVQRFMATIFPKAGSPYYFIKYRDTAGNWRMKSTKLRWDDAKQKNQAKALCATTTADELRKGAGSVKEAWGAWVQEFLDLHYAKGGKTHTRYQTCWNVLSDYLEAKKIFGPRNLTYEDVTNYFVWRKANSVLKKGASKNTALYELRFLKLVMKQAIRRFGLAMQNPCAELGIKKDPAKEKPEITVEDREKIRLLLKERPEWMQVSFEIGIHQGCRLMETSLPLAHINVEKREIQFHAKGKKVFTTKLHEGLVPLIAKLKADKCKMT